MTGFKAAWTRIMGRTSGTRGGQARGNVMVCQEAARWRPSNQHQQIPIAARHRKRWRIAEQTPAQSSLPPLLGWHCKNQGIRVMLPWRRSLNPSLKESVVMIVQIKYGTDGFFMRVCTQRRLQEWGWGRWARRKNRQGCQKAGAQGLQGCQHMNMYGRRKDLVQYESQKQSLDTREKFEEWAHCEWVGELERKGRLVKG